jgi:hypothetical protein
VLDTIIRQQAQQITYIAHGASYKSLEVRTEHNFYAEIEKNKEKKKRKIVIIAIANP